MYGSVVAVGPRKSDGEGRDTFARVVINQVLLESQSYTRNKNRSNSFVRTRHGHHYLVKSYFAQGNEVFASAIRLELGARFEFAQQIVKLTEGKEVVSLPVADIEEGPMTVLSRGSSEFFLVDFPFTFEVS